MRPAPFVFLTLLCLLPTACASAQQVPAPSWQPFEEAVAAARQSGRPVLVAVYAPWCGWCRRLDREVYTDAAVRSYLDRHFVVTRLNGDDSRSTYRFQGRTFTGTQLAHYLGMRGFPHTVFLSSSSNYLGALPGYVDAAPFLEVLQQVTQQTQRSASGP